MNQTILVVLYAFHLLKRTGHKSHLFGSDCTICFWFTKFPVYKSHLFMNQTMLFELCFCFSKKNQFGEDARINPKVHHFILCLINFSIIYSTDLNKEHFNVACDQAVMVTQFRIKHTKLFAHFPLRENKNTHTTRLFSNNFSRTIFFTTIPRIHRWFHDIKFTYDL